MINHTGDLSEDRLITLRKRAEVDAKNFITFTNQDASEQKRSLARLNQVFTFYIRFICEIFMFSWLNSVIADSVTSYLNLSWCFTKKKVVGSKLASRRKHLSSMNWGSGTTSRHVLFFSVSVKIC